MSEKKKTVDTYGFDPELEQLIALAECSEPRFHSAIGALIEVDRLKSEEAKLLVASAHVVAKRTGMGCSKPLFAFQHLINLMDAGKVTLDQLDRCRDYLIDAEAAGLEDIDQVIHAVLPVIRKLKHKETVVRALDDYKNNADASETATAFEQVSKIGLQSQKWGSSFDQLIARPSFYNFSLDKPLPTGIEEIDMELGGGMERKAIGLIVGGSGAGKSIALSHISAEGLLRGLDTVYVSLELSEEMIGRRLLRNLIDMTQREMDLDPATAAKRYQMLKSEGLGRMFVGYCEPLVTGPKDIKSRIKEYCREHRDFDPKLFVFDYADKMRVNVKASSYDDQGAVMEGLRTIAGEYDGWSWTASQANRKATGRPWLDLDATADSLNKNRVADIVIAIGRTEEDEAENKVRFSIPKRREGEGAHKHIGPLDWDPEHGRIVIVNRTYPW